MALLSTCQRNQRVTLLETSVFTLQLFCLMKSMQYYASCMREIDNEGWGRGLLLVGGAYYSHAAGKK